MDSAIQLTKFEELNLERKRAKYSLYCTQKPNPLLLILVYTRIAWVKA